MKDKILLEDILAELAFEPSLDAACIGVTVDDGAVTLSGHVPNYAQKGLARAAVERVQGVQEVTDALEVFLTAPNLCHDDDLARRALTLLDLNVLVPAGRVLVKVEAGWITLSGEVEWRFQRDAAVEGASRLRGVQGLEDRIVVTPKVAAVDIPHRISHALRRSGKAEGLRLTITARDGVVRLDGEASSWSDRHAIETAAWAAPGVRAVDDHIRISSR